MHNSSLHLFDPLQTLILLSLISFHFKCELAEKHEATRCDVTVVVVVGV